MPAPRRTLAAAALGGILLLVALGGRATPAPEDPAPAGPGLVTLYSGDPVAHVLDLATGAFGARIDGTLLRETRAHLDYGTYADDALTLALDEDDRGLWIDLGHWADIARDMDIEEADGGGIVFASISVDGSEVRVAKRFPRDSFQNLPAGRPLLSSLAGERRVAVHPVAGHIYLARVEHRHRKTPPVHAKILVVAHRPGDSVVLRWEPVPGL